MALFDEWEARWDAAQADFTAQDTTDALYGDARLELNAGADSKKAISWDNVGIPSETEVLALVEVPNLAGGEFGMCQLFARGSGVAGTETGYYIDIANDSDFSVARYNDGTANTLGTFGAPVAGTQYWLRLRITNTGTAGENRVRGKQWEEGVAEPTGWDIDTIDSNSGIDSSGWVGLGGNSDLAQQFDWFAVGTGGETAPLPADVNIAAAPDGPVTVGASTPDADISTTSPFVSPDGPVSVSADTPDADVTVENVTAAPDGPVSVSADTPDADVAVTTFSEPVLGGATLGDEILGGVSDARTAAPDGPVTVGTTTPDAEIHAFIEFTTNLPDVTGLTIDTGTARELTPSWDDNINNGSHRVQHKISSTSVWIDDGTVGEATTSKTITNLVDGEKYDVRVRTETEHVTGDWLTDTALTSLPAPSSLTTTSATATEWTVTWMDNANNENDYLIERRRQYDGGFGPWTTLATLAAGTESYTDSDVVPDTTYEYRVTVRTDHTTSATTFQDTTPSLGYGTRRVESSGWTVEVIPTDGGDPRRPAIVGEPNYDPSLKSLPRVELPVKKDEAWSESQWEDAAVRVWQDGIRLPIETLRGVEHQPGQTMLSALGGVELLEPQDHEFGTDIHTAAGDVIDETSYAEVIDTPSVSGGTLLREVDAPEDFQILYEDPGPQYPVMVDDTGTVPDETGIQLTQTCFLAEAEADTTDSTHSNNYPGDLPNWSDDEAAALPTDDNDVTFTFELDHEIPAGEVGFAIHRILYDFDGTVTATIDGQVTEELEFQGSTVSDTIWIDKNTGANGTEYTDTLSVGSHTIEISVSSVASGDYYVDAVAVFDLRYHTQSNFDELAGGDTYFDTPALYPTSGIDVKLLYQGFQSASGARYDNSTWTDTSGDQALALSNDGGSTWHTCSNCETLEVDFADPGPDILIRLTLDAWGDRDEPTERASPLFNFKSQINREFDLFGDIRDSAPLRNDVFETDARDILTALAERGNALWAVTWDDTNGITVEFTNSGQRTVDRSLDLVDYTWSKETLDRQIEWAEIKGGSQRVQSETITADLGNAVELNHDNLISGREQVFNQDRSQTYTRGVDYEMEYLLGNVRATTTGDITDGETLVVDYEWKPEGEYARGTNEKKKLVRTFVGATDDSTCQAIAYYLTEELDDPVRSGEAIIDELPPGVSVLDALAIDPVPDTDDYHVREIDRRPGETRLRLADRRRVQDVVSNISARLGDHGDRI